MTISRLQNLRQHEELFAKLYEKLIAADRTFKTEPADSDCQNFKREGIVAALMAVQEYLRAQGVEANVRDPIRSMIGALGDLENGRMNPITDPNKREGGGRNSISNDDAALRGLAAGTVTLLMASGAKLQEAARRVARALSQEGFTISNREDRDHTQSLINFRKALMAGRGKNETAAGVYNNAVSLHPKEPNAGERLLKELTKKVKKVSKPQ